VCAWFRAFCFVSRRMIASCRRYASASMLRRRNTSTAHDGIGRRPICQSRMVRGVRWRSVQSAWPERPRAYCSNSIGLAQRFVLFFMRSKKTASFDAGGCLWRPPMMGVHLDFTRIICVMLNRKKLWARLQQALRAIQARSAT